MDKRLKLAPILFSRGGFGLAPELALTNRFRTDSLAAMQRAVRVRNMFCRLAAVAMGIRESDERDIRDKN
jgi:hypothetical protein